MTKNADDSEVAIRVHKGKEVIDITAKDLALIIAAVLRALAERVESRESS